MTETATATEPDALRAALTYASRGWPVAPAHSVKDDRSCTCGDPKCTSRGKHPLTAHGLKDATTDPDTIRSWWQRWPHANVLIRTGMVGDRCLVVLDIDPRHHGDESLAKLIVEHGPLPETPMCCTGGGGQHIFMWSPRAVPNSAGKAGDGRFGEGVDVRGEGGYVIAAPSKHESGRAYEWDSGAHPADVTLAQSPDWFVRLAGWSRKRAEVGPQDEGVERYITGGRNDALTRLGGAMRRVGAGLKRITDALLDENEERCHPPLDPAEVKKIARSVCKYPSGDPSPAGVDLFPMLTAADLATELAPVSWVCESLGIAPGAVTIVGGAGFGGKTVSMQAFALAVASGSKLWGEYDVPRGRAVHIDYEQGRRLTQDRYQRIARAMGVSLSDLEPRSFGLCTLPRGTLDGDLKVAEDNVVRLCEGARVAVVDAFRGAFPEAKENESNARRYLDMLQQASERTGCAMIVIAHSRKANENSDDVRSSLRGSSALFDAAQTVYMLDGWKGRPTKVHNTKDRILGETRETFGIEIKDVAVDGNPRWGLNVHYVSPPEVQAAYMRSDDDIAASAERLESCAARVMAIVSGGGANGVSASMMRAMFGISVTDLNATLTILIQNGSVRVEGKGSTSLYFATSREPGVD